MIHDSYDDFLADDSVPWAVKKSMTRERFDALRKMLQDSEASYVRAERSPAVHKRTVRVVIAACDVVAASPKFPDVGTEEAVVLASAYDLLNEAGRAGLVKFSKLPREIHDWVVSVAEAHVVSFSADAWIEKARALSGFGGSPREERWALVSALDVVSRMARHVTYEYLEGAGREDSPDGIVVSWLYAAGPVTAARLRHGLDTRIGAVYVLNKGCPFVEQWVLPLMDGHPWFDPADTPCRN